jgi:hypothetical protein
MHGLLEVLIRQGILRFPSIDQSQEFVNLKAVGEIVQQILQFRGCFREMTRVIVSHSFLELAVQPLTLLGPCCNWQGQSQCNQTRTR